MIESAAIGFFLLVAIAGATMAAFVRHTLYSIVGLGVSLAGVAGLFLSLGSPFVAAMQILIYIGGITVAMVFAMMLSEAFARRHDFELKKIVPAVVIALAFAGSVGALIIKAPFAVRDEVAAPEQWEVAQIGHAFLTDYNVVFEGLSIVLLLAIMAAVVIARPEEEAK